MYSDCISDVRSCCVSCLACSLQTSSFSGTEGGRLESDDEILRLVLGDGVDIRYSGTTWNRRPRSGSPSRRGPTVPALTLVPVLLDESVTAGELPATAGAPGGMPELVVSERPLSDPSSFDEAIVSVRRSSYPLSRVYG